MELAKTCERSRQKPWPSPSAARAQHTRATCANETAEKWPENGPTDSPVVNPDCKRAFIIRRPGEGEGGGRKGSAQWRTSGTPRFCCFLVSRWQCHVANLHPTTRGGSPEFLPSLRSRFFFFLFFLFLFFFFFLTCYSATRNRKERSRLKLYCLVFSHGWWDGSMGFFNRLSSREY